MTDLATWMREHDETDETLAPKLGVSRVQVLRIRRRQCNPSVRTALRLEEVSEGDLPAIEMLSRERLA